MTDITQHEIDTAALQEMVVRPLREEIARLTEERDEWKRLALQNEQTAKDALRTDDWRKGMHAGDVLGGGY
jgi:uncharacterized protein YigA (DUF484 family)